MRRRSRVRTAGIAAVVALTAAGCLVASGPAGAATGPVEIFASPTGGGSDCTQAAPCSLASAIAKERAAEPTMSTDIVIYLHGGRYPVSSTIMLDGRDSGLNEHRVILRNYPDESPVLSGGELISGWTQGSDGVWSANAHGLNFFQLYGDGVRFTRARTHAVSGHRWTIENSRARKIEVSDEILPGCTLTDLAGVQVRIMHTWRELRYPVGSVGPGSGSDTCFVGLTGDIAEWSDGGSGGLNPIADTSTIDGPIGETFLSGAKEFLDQNDEWYLDTATDTVYLKSSVDPNTLHVTAPVTKELLDISGASHITIYGLQFAHSAWNEPLVSGNFQRQGGLHMTDQPAGTTSAGTITWYVNPAAVRVGESDDIRFQRNGFRDTGGNAVDLDAGTTFVRFIANIFTQISDTGLFVGTAQEPKADPGQLNVNTVVQDNYFNWMGQTYATDSAIAMTYPHQATVEHNEIDNVHNIGINIGWFNETGGATTVTDLQDVHVTDNRLDHLCITARDCGGWHSLRLYNYGGDNSIPRSTVSGNYVTDVHANSLSAKGQVRALYVDATTNGLEIAHNEWANVDEGLHRNSTAGDDLDIHDNQTGDQTVIDNAGLESAYSFLKTLDLATDSIGGTKGPYPTP